MMKCEYCDNPVPNGVNRCPSCGAPISCHSAKDVVVDVVNMLRVSDQTESRNSYLLADQKNRLAYIISAVFLGEFGVHNFYAGYIGRGIVQLLISVLSFGILFWVSWIWALIEAAVVQKDAKGVPFK